MNIRIVREAGGLGDVVRCTVVARAFREKYPDAKIWVFAPRPYWSLWEACGCVDHLINTPYGDPSKRRRRSSPIDTNKWNYLAGPKGVEFDITADLFDPAFLYELKMGRKTDKDRIQLWCDSSGVKPKSYTPLLMTKPEHEAKADEIMVRLIGKRPIIGIQPFSTDRARDWPMDSWLKLIASLEATKCKAVVLDHSNARLKPFKSSKLIALPFMVLAAVLKRFDVVVGPDSGVNHLAASVGAKAIGVVASQPMEVTYRWYPTHTWVNPGSESKYKCWPCMWQRPRECTRRRLKEAGKTCPAQATITVERVFDEIMRRIGRHKVEEAPLCDG